MRAASNNEPQYQDFLSYCTHSARHFLTSKCFFLTWSEVVSEVLYILDPVFGTATRLL